MIRDELVDEDSVFEHGLCALIIFPSDGLSGEETSFPALLLPECVLGWCVFVAAFALCDAGGEGWLARSRWRSAVEVRELGFSRGLPLLPVVVQGDARGLDDSVAAGGWWRIIIIVLNLVFISMMMMMMMMRGLLLLMQ